QGAQSVGMGKDFYDNYDIAKKLFDEADEVLGYSIKNMCFNGSENDLKLTANTQPAILIVSVIVSEILKSNGINPNIAGGHSLGEYSALVAADVIDFKDAVLLVHKRGQFMQEAVPVGEGSMAAIIGLDDNTIVEICNKISSDVGAVQAVNFNCPGQTVIAGTTKGVDAAVDELKAAGAKKAVVLPVSAPFHSTLMAPAAKKLAVELDKVEFRDAKFPIAANVNGELETKAEIIKQNLITQADHPVKWIACVDSMKNFGADTFIEAGPGKTLCGFNKRIDRKLVSLNVEDMESLQKTISVLMSGK
ncbi:MAG: ACP S-malonyltransferase, partial [Selenomonadaceae bacterium]|nr:ACP S-malonyltransferase [Selenomonadaceae bacterium]